MEPLLDIGDVCRLLACSETTVRGMCRSRSRARHCELALPYIRMGRAVRFRADDIRAWLDRLAEANKKERA